jgi:hypothetical protein
MPHPAQSIAGGFLAPILAPAEPVQMDVLSPDLFCNSWSPAIRIPSASAVQGPADVGSSPPTPPLSPARALG